MLERSFARLRGIDDLKWLRLASALLLGAVAAATFRLLCAAKWDRTMTALVAAILVVLPGAQLLVSWTVGWPINVALLLALAAFACAERAFGANAAEARLSFLRVGTRSLRVRGRAGRPSLPPPPPSFAEN